MDLFLTMIKVLFHSCTTRFVLALFADLWLLLPSQISPFVENDMTGYVADIFGFIFLLFLLSSSILFLLTVILLASIILGFRLRLIALVFIAVGLFLVAARR